MNLIADREHGRISRELGSWPLPVGIHSERELTAEFRVVGDELSIQVNGQMLGTVRDSTYTAKGDAYLFCSETGTRVSKVEVLDLDGAGAVPDAGWQNAINLLPLIDPQKDAAGGKWTWIGNTLASDSAQNGRIAIPYQPPQEYDYRLVFHVTEGYTPEGAGQVIQILSKGGRLFSWIMGAKKGEFIAFETIAGANSADPANPTITQRKAALQKNVTYTSIVEVRNDGLKAHLNGELLAQWKTDYTDMGIVPHWKLSDPTLLGVGSWLTGLVIEKLEVREVTGKGKFTRGAPSGASTEEWNTLSNGWRIGKPVNLGPVVNSSAYDISPCISADGLTLFFDSQRENHKDAYWASTRSSLTMPWSIPSKVDDLNRLMPIYRLCFSSDGLALFFCSTASSSGAKGNRDICFVTRKNPSELWGKPQNAGPNVNTEHSECFPFLSADGLTLIFSSDRPGGIGDNDLWICTRPTRDSPWAMATNPGAPLNSAASDSSPCLTADGLALFFTSDRDGGVGSYDIWMATRRSLTQPFGQPVNLGKSFNTRNIDGGPSLSPDGRMLYFDSDRDRARDIWQAPILPPDTSSSTPNPQHSNPSAALSAFCAEVAALPAEQQVARVAAKLKELNPEFDPGTVKHTVENNRVAILSFNSMGVTNLTPVQALRSLRYLDCSGPNEGWKRSPLQDVSPVRDIKLKGLSCYHTKVADLSPLRGMPLESLECFNTPVADLTPLQGLPLKNLHIMETPISDLTPLSTLKQLGSLILHNNPNIRDLSPLRGLPLKSLGVSRLGTSDLSPLAGLPLEHIGCDDSLIALPNNLKLLRSIQTLKTINKLPTAEFWKQLAPGEVPKP